MLSVPAKLITPPPRVAAVLPEIVELVIDEVWPRLLLKLKMPPPPLETPVDVLPLIVLSTTASVPAKLSMPPPSSA